MHEKVSLEENLLLIINIHIPQAEEKINILLIILLLCI